MGKLDSHQFLHSSSAFHPQYILHLCPFFEKFLELCQQWALCLTSFINAHLTMPIHWILHLSNTNANCFAIISFSQYSTNQIFLSYPSLRLLVSLYATMQINICMCTQSNSSEKLSPLHHLLCMAELQPPLSKKITCTLTIIERQSKAVNCGRKVIWWNKNLLCHFSWIVFKQHTANIECIISLIRRWSHNIWCFS